ncbi:hypothetical protein GCM10020331_017150 [Ectobacillus funiculus]
MTAAINILCVVEAFPSSMKVERKYTKSNNTKATRNTCIVFQRDTERKKSQAQSDVPLGKQKKAHLTDDTEDKSNP